MNRLRRLAMLLGMVAAAYGGEFRAEKLAEIDAAIERAIADRKCPGGVLWIEQRGAVYRKAYGSRALEPAREAMTEDTAFDLASLTKVVATAPAIVLLIERGQLELDAPAGRYWPEFAAHGKEAITLRQLLTHTSGLRPGIGGGREGRDAALAQVCAESPTAAPGSAFRYSDINFIALGEIVRRVSGRSLDEFCVAEIFAPLGMASTRFLPPADWRARIAPTTRDVPRGVVHDPTARRMGGVAGHAGLFGTAEDLARYARALLRVDAGLFKGETLRRMTSPQGAGAVWELRGLGWDIDSPYAGPRGLRFGPASFGHTGWTGGSLWIDPWARAFVIFLSNRNHPTESGSVIGLRRELGTLAAEALADAPE